MNEIIFYKDLSDYIDGSMSEEEKKKFESDLLKDKSLNQKVDQMKKMINDIKSSDDLLLPSNFSSKLKSAIERENNSSIYQPLNVFKIFDNPVIATISSVAAIILVVVTTNLSFSGFGGYNADESNQIAIFNDEFIDFEEIENQEKHDVLKDIDIERVDFNLKYEDN